MIKKALVIVPHGDDEINLVGTIMDQFTEKKIDIVVMFVTNGDFDKNAAQARMKETVSVVQKMQFSKAIFLGYPDNCKEGNRHIFDVNNEYLYESMAGKTETYGIQPSTDYRYDISGYHHPYYLKNIEKDIRECIVNENADMIIYPDWDSHPDHRMVTVLVDSILADLACNIDYRPIVLKKFAYAGVWYGIKDYYDNPMKETVLSEEEFFPNAPQNRIQIKVNERMYPLRYWKSPVYSWLKLYETQHAAESFASIVNADALYFYRDTSNLALDARIEASSGNTGYINDFQFIKIRNINDTPEEIRSYYKDYTWIPESSDTERSLTFTFKKKTELKQISFSVPDQLKNQKVQLRILLDNGFTETITFENCLQYTYLFQEKQSSVGSMTIRLEAFSGGEYGFSEIEIFDRESVFPWNDVPFKEYHDDPAPRSRFITTIIYLRKRGMSYLRKIRRYLKRNLTVHR